MTEQQSDTPENELEELATSALDGRASTRDVQKLETLLIDSEKHRRTYLDRVGFEDSLERAIRAGSLGSSPIVEAAEDDQLADGHRTIRSGRRVSGRMLQAALFSTVLIALVCVVLSSRRSSDQKYLTPESGLLVTDVPVVG